MSNSTVFFHKFPGIDSFVPAPDAGFSYGQEHMGDGIYRLWMAPEQHSPGTGAPGSPRWPLVETSFDPCTTHAAGLPDMLDTRISWDHRGLSVHASDTPLLKALDTKGLRLCGSAWALTLEYHDSMRFYGQGQKSGPLERTGQAVKFWNADVAGEFATSQLKDADTDPMYVSIPWLMIAQEGLWVGILLDNPYMSFMYANKDPRFFVPLQRNNHVILGSTDGAPALYVLTASSASGLVRKFQRMVGVHPRPPLWALGHHQSRWGYDHTEHLEEVAQGMKIHDIPNSGLWLDIGYMDEYRVFTWNPATMPDPGAEFDRLRKVYGERIVPIIDPGVKLEPGYGVYDSGKQQGVYCQTPEGSDYVGYVWPGETVFPDFSRPEVRQWWAAYCKTFMEQGIDGAWIDMNDPSTGWADAGFMQFQEGKRPHDWYHNRYAKGMAQATFEGFAQARPDRRVFIISRSAYTGQAPWSAVWLGDNLSNWNHLRTMIPMCINLSLSGIPFNGPDAPGFNETPTPFLAREWYKAQFLFPFLRNHSCFYFPRQEPWAFGKRTMKAIRHYIRLRYRLLPYLYQCFVDHNKVGDPVVRPLWYASTQDFEQTSRLSDQFLTGPSILQAPFVDESSKKRTVYLPQGDWYNLSTAQWQKGGQTVSVSRSFTASPAWVQAGAVIPCQGEHIQADQPDPWDVEFHVFAVPENQSLLSFNHVFDDGESTAWQKGDEVRLSGEILLDLSAKTARVELEKSGADHPVRISFCFYAPVMQVSIKSGINSAPVESTTQKNHTTWTSNKTHRTYQSVQVVLP